MGGLRILAKFSHSHSLWRPPCLLFDCLVHVHGKLLQCVASHAERSIPDSRSYFICLSLIIFISLIFFVEGACVDFRGDWAIRKCPRSLTASSHSLSHSKSSSTKYKGRSPLRSVTNGALWRRRSFLLVLLFAMRHRLAAVQ
jgi:hypothetical protein